MDFKLNYKFLIYLSQIELVKLTGTCPEALVCERGALPSFYVDKEYLFII